MMRTLGFIFISIFIGTPLIAQWQVDGQVISALGLAADRRNINVNSTLGEAIIYSKTGGDVKVLQGFQRNRNALLTRVFQPVDPSFEILAYPNPCDHEFRIISSIGYKSLNCYSMDGRLIAHWPVVQDRYSTSHLPKGMYILRAQIQYREIAIQTLIIQ